MMKSSPVAIIATGILLFAAVSTPPPSVYAFGGSAATIAVAYGSATTVCTIIASQSIQRLQCWSNGQLLPPILPAISFDAVAGGRDIICGINSGGFSLICWNANFTIRRLYNSASAPLNSLAVGDGQICALRNTASVEEENAICWRGDVVSSSRNGNSQLRMISSGFDFSCGVVDSNSRVLCWGDDEFALSIQSEFDSLSMSFIQVGGRHACGIDDSGFVICRGLNNNGQLNVPSNLSREYRDLAVGANHSCAIRRLNRTVVCWGGNGEFSSTITNGISFESIVAGFNFTCGLVTGNLSVLCWGPGWPNISNPMNELPLQRTLPGPCVNTVCQCNLYPQSAFLCSGNGHVCRPCDNPILIPIAPQSPPPLRINPSPSRGGRRGFLAYAIVGSVGVFVGICAIIYCLWIGVGKKQIHNSVQPTITTSAVAQQCSSNTPSRSSTLRRQGSFLMRRQRSGTSSVNTDKALEFMFSDLALATNNFSIDNKIGSGSFGVVYRGKLLDDRVVAIKRCETGSVIAFDSELAFLSRLHHKHLVGLLGYCQERDERLLVYEYMANGALFDHLHSKKNAENSNSVVNSWKIRIKISLEAARGIEYLHTYAVPPIIHRDIKSSNILLDENWTARVSDFGLSLMEPVNGHDHSRQQPVKAAGTVGYIDPEYYGLNVLTTKSDVYGLGVVLLELLTGKRAIFKMDDGHGPMSLVDYAVPAISAGELSKILDPRVGPAEVKESEAIELVAYTAVHCVHLEGKDRPTITDVAGNLDRALALCRNSHGRISSDRNGGV